MKGAQWMDIRSDRQKGLSYIEHLEYELAKAKVEIAKLKKASNWNDEVPQRRFRKV